MNGTLKPPPNHIPQPRGRVLGKPVPVKSIGAALATRPPPASPSESSVSVPSHSSFALESGITTPNGRFQNGKPGSGTDTPGRMICPICEEDMVTLLQLNRHLDDAHRDVEEMEKDDIQSWFQKKLFKAKQFQPVALLNQKLKGLEVFEANDNLTPAGTPSATTTPSQFIQPVQPTLSSRDRDRDRDPDEVVTRTHWQRSSGRDLCTDPACGRSLGVTNGSVNCRKCGKLFCDEHTMYQIKLSRAALHEPVRGIWCRVCETCYMSREGYLDHKGLVNDHTDEFSRLRRKGVDRKHLETTRLEKRLTKLTNLLTSPPSDTPSSPFLWPVNGLRNQRKLLEQSIVPWEDDATVPSCPFCKQLFNFSLRKHHCRLCGRVVCGDVRTGCSGEVGLNVSSNNATTNGVSTETPLDVRICKDCHSIVFSRKDFEAELAKKPSDQRSYETLVQFEKGIIAMLPRFQKMLGPLQDPNNPPNSKQLAEASKTRKKLMETFSQYDRTAKHIATMPTTSPTQLALQKAIHRFSIDFLHTKMLPLKALPKILKSHPSAANSLPSTRSATPSVTSTSNLSIVAPPPNNRSLSHLSSVIDGDNSSLASSIDTEEKELKEMLAVLEEQKFLVGEMIGSAKQGRRFDEVGALSLSLRDLEDEIEKTQEEIKDFEKRTGQV